MKSRKPRRSDRVSVSLPIHVSWSVPTGRQLAEKTQALVINRHGATIILRRKLAPAQEITIRSEETEKVSSARVVGEIGKHPDGYLYGVSLQDPSVNLWGVDFPSLAESETAVARQLLECDSCRTREVVYLDELQTEVFEANRSLSRSCERCSAWTLWKLAFHEAPAQRNLQGLQPQPVPASPRAPASRTRNERKDVRVPLKVTACIRQPGALDEVVDVDNVSRGGLRFWSRKTYLKGSRIEVAVPYTPGAPAIFVDARIVRCRELQGKRTREYGAAYLRTPNH